MARQACFWLCCWISVATACGVRSEPSSEPIDARAAPEQLDVEAEQAELPAAVGDARLTPRARYRIAARVLSKERYFLGWRSRLSPVDLALGWAAMSDPAVDRFIDWHQGGRWYFWQWSAGSPYQNEAIRTHSANVHVVPATLNLRRALLALDADELIALSGYLVDIAGPEGESWKTSLSRTDTGNRSCELLYVTELRADARVYR